MNEFKIESAFEVFKKYFKVDPNRISFESSNLDFDPIEIKTSEDIMFFFGREFAQYKRNTVIARQLHAEFISDMLQTIETNGIPSRLILKGPIGVGKTTSLLIIGQIAKEMNILVFPIDARLFTNREDIETTTCQFIKKWSEKNEAILNHLNSKQNHYEFKFDKLTKENAVKTLREIIDHLKLQSIIPVLFIVDECNAFHHPHRFWQNNEIKEITDPVMNPIGRFFCGDINNFAISRGGVIFAYSSIFEFKSKNFTNWITEVRPFSSHEWISLFKTEVRSI